MRFRKMLCGFSLLLVTTAVVAQDQDQKQENATNPFSGLNNLLKGVTGSLNGAIKQVNSAAAEAQAGKPRSAQENAVTSEKAVTPVTVERAQPGQSTSRDSSPLLGTTILNGIFAKHPYDGTAKSHYPKVALTVMDWTSSDCWRARAKIWWGPNKNEQLGSFKVCWRDSLSRAADNAVGYQLFMRQMSLEDTGNIRTEGPKAPMMAYPMPDPFGVSNYSKGQQAISFIQQVLIETGWQTGAPTNIWVVKFDTSVSSEATALSASIPVLDSFKKCDVTSMPKLPVTLPGGLKIVKVRPGMYGDGDNRGMKLVFDRRMERVDKHLKQTTGYDFTSTNRPKRGEVGFDRDESGDEDNYLICYRQREGA